MTEYGPRGAIQLCAEFVDWQKTLLKKWTTVNPSSRDFEYLADFPKQSTFDLGESTWRADRHGCGVRFVCDDGLEVDVPFGVDVPEQFDENRVYDFCQSKTGRDGGAHRVVHREDWCELIGRLVDAKLLRATTDSLGRRILRIR